MPDRTVKRRLQDAGDAALADDDGPIFSTVAKLVDALKRSIPEGTANVDRKKEALRLGQELLRGRAFCPGVVIWDERPAALLDGFSTVL